LPVTWKKRDLLSIGDNLLFKKYVNLYLNPTLKGNIHVGNYGKRQSM